MTTAKDLKKQVDNLQSSAESAVDSAQSALKDVTEEVSYQAKSMKRNPLALTLLAVLGLGVIVAVIMWLSEKSSE